MQMFALFSAFLCSLVCSALIIRYKSLHQHLSGDTDFSSPQKFHHFVVPRIGGLAILGGLTFGALIRSFQDGPNGALIWIIILCSLPAFLCGLYEDISKKAGIFLRLLGTALSAYLAGIFLGSWINHLSIWGVDYLLTLPYVYMLVTLLAICGLANAYNIIDGFNGLASMVGMISILAICYVCFRVGDIHLLIAGLIMVGSIMGFFLWNYPRGLIFLGDGGAYLIGFWIGVLSILLVNRNPIVSPWFAFLVNAYPIFETLFSMWRRKVHQGKNPGMPDGAHFHTLIYRRVMKWAMPNQIGSVDDKPSARGNARTSPYLWALSSMAVFPAMLFWQHTWVLQLFSLLFCVSYVFIYRSIVRFNTPTWLFRK